MTLPCCVCKASPQSPVNECITLSKIHISWLGVIKCLHTDQIRPICLPVSEPLRSQDLTGYQPFVAGWGSTIFMGPQSTFIREAQIPIVSLSDCSRNYRTYFPNQVFDSRVMCAGYGGRDTCQGNAIYIY